MHGHFIYGKIKLKRCTSFIKKKKKERILCNLGLILSNFWEFGGWSQFF
jgi:hypothetical protein